MLRPAARALALAAVVAASVTPVAGQIPRLVAEGRVGAAVPTGGFSDLGAGTGTTWGVGFAFAARGGLYVHVGFSQDRFACDTCADPGDLTGTGFDLALRYAFDAGVALPWIRVGVLPYTLESEPRSGSDPSVSDHDWGWEAGAGVSFRLSDRLHLSPGARYVRMSPTFEGGQAVDVQAVLMDVGLVWAF